MVVDGGRILFRLLGDLEVEVDGRPLVIRGAGQRALLARLLLDADHLVALDRLIDDLWEESGRVKSVQVAVTRLRGQLGPLSGHLITRGGGYELRLDGGELDTERFEAAVTAASAALAAGDPAAALAHAVAALSIWRGPPLAEFAHEAWSLRARDRLEDLRWRATEVSLEARLAHEEAREVIADLRRAVATWPDRERARGMLMLALYRDGRQADALQVYRDTRTHLVDAYGIEPGVELSALHAAILRHDPALHPDPARGGRPGPPPAELGAVQARLRVRPAARLVGRGAELEVLQDGLATAAAGERAGVIVSGEPGVGKTRLLSEVAERARAAGWTVLGGHSDADVELPYQPFVEALAELIAQAPESLLRAHAAEHGFAVGRLAPGLTLRLAGRRDATGDPSESERYLLFAAVDGLLGAAGAQRPVLLLLEDLHWADRPSLQLLRYLFGATRPARLLVAISMRDTEPGVVAPAMTELLAGAERDPHVRLIRLAGLAEPEVRTLAGDVLRRPLAPEERPVAARIHADTGGNPLFVIELVRALLGPAGSPGGGPGGPGRGAGEVPATILAVLRDRVERLTPACRDLLTLIAVTPGGATLELLAAADPFGMAAVADAVDEAVAAGILTEQTDRDTTTVEFVHPLFRVAIAEQASATRRMALHLRIADVMERMERAGDALWRSELAHHLFSAGRAARPERVIAACRLAGDAALAATAFDQAIANYGRALTAMGWTEPPWHADRPGVSVRTAEAHHAIGDEAGRRTAAEAAFIAATQAGQPRMVARAALVYGGARSTYGRAGVRTLELVRAGLAALDAEPDAGLRAMLTSRLAQECYHTGDHALADRLSAEALELAAATGDERVRATALEGRIWALHRPEALDERLAVTAEMIERAERAGDRTQLIWGLIWRSCAELEAGRLDRADADVERLRAATETLQIPSQMFRVLTMRATRAIMAGDWARGTELAQEVYAIGAQIEPDNARQVLAAQLLPMLREQGYLAGLVDEARALTEAYPGAPSWRCAYALVCLEAGAEAEARAALESIATAGLAALPRDLAWLLALSLLSEVVAALGDVPRAAELYDLLAPYEHRHAAVFDIACTGSVAHQLGLLARTLGRFDRAEAHLQTAIEANDRTGQLPAAARSRYEYARTLAAAPEATNGAPAALLAEALGTARRLGLTQLIAAIDRCAAA